MVQKWQRQAAFPGLFGRWGKNDDEVFMRPVRLYAKK